MMSSYIQALVLAAFVVLSKAIPIGEDELSSATSYSSSNFGYKDTGSEDVLSHLGDFNSFETSQLGSEEHDNIHIPAPIYTHHVVTPIIKKVPVLIKHESVEDEEEHYEVKPYEFHYAVEDKHTGDIKSQKESSDGHNVQGEYSLKEADGTTRIVKYTADKKNGFNAVVIRKGHAAHPQVETKTVEIKKVVPILEHYGGYGDLSSHY